MSRVDVIRAWRDEEYRNNLSAEVRASLPGSPAGMVDISDAEAIKGGITGTLATRRCDSVCQVFSC